MTTHDDAISSFSSFASVSHVVVLAIDFSYLALRWHRLHHRCLLGVVGDVGHRKTVKEMKA
jgi:hypothetical protein